MNTTPQEKQRLLIVDDSKVVRVTARKILRDHFETVEALDGENAWEFLTSEAPFSLVISDLSMPNLDGFGLLERIRKSHLPHISDLPVIIITGANDSETIKARATQAGATDFIGKPFDAVHLLARAQAHASAHTRARVLREETLALEDESVIDPLTRIANESAFMERGYQHLAYAIRHNTRLSVFRIEIDSFDGLYKTHGDCAVENIIQTVATVLTTAIRHEDTAARIGTARFALLLPSLNNNGIHNLADRIRKTISERTLKHGNTRINYTISIGVAATEIRRDTRFDDLLSMASNRLAHAVAHGGDQVVYEGESFPAHVRRADMEKDSADQAREIETTLPGVPAESANPPPTPDQNNPAPLHVPDLSLATEPKADFSMHGQHSDDETIVITAASNPYIPIEQVIPELDINPGTTDTSNGQAPAVTTVHTSNDEPPMETVDIRTARIGILERLLAGMQSLFRKPRNPD